MTRMESPPRGGAAWSVLFATVSILAFAVPAHAQVTPLVVGFDDTDYRVVEGESLTVTVTLTPAADRQVVIPIEATSYTLGGVGAEAGDYTVVCPRNGFTSTACSRRHRRTPNFRGDSRPACWGDCENPTVNLF